MSIPSSTERVPSGPAIAAFISAALGLFAMAIANLIQDAVPGVYDTLVAIGSWIPYVPDSSPDYRNMRVSPFSGNETLLLVVWLGSWALLHQAFRKRDSSVSPWTIVLILLIFASVLFCWPPVAYILGLRQKWW